MYEYARHCCSVYPNLAQTVLTNVVKLADHMYLKKNRCSFDIVWKPVLFRPNLPTFVVGKYTFKDFCGGIVVEALSQSQGLMRCQLHHDKDLEIMTITIGIGFATFERKWISRFPFIKNPLWTDLNKTLVQNSYLCKKVCSLANKRWRLKNINKTMVGLHTLFVSLLCWIFWRKYSLMISKAIQTNFCML